MKEDSLSNSQKIEAIKWWQTQEFLHPLTCIDSSHRILEPKEEEGVVMLYCRDCDYIQKNIPKPVYDLYLSRERFDEIWKARRKSLRK